MTDLRKAHAEHGSTSLRLAAEQALEALENIDRWLPTIGQKGLRDYEADAIEALRQALAEDALGKLAEIDHNLGLFIDSPNVDETPECSDHPDAPHGFSRDRSITLGRYVCDCEGWAPEDADEWIGLSDSDIAEAMHGNVEGSNMLPYQFARAIEAKLKEKNND